jgi:hypothetical protein
MYFHHFGWSILLKSILIIIIRRVRSPRPEELVPPPVYPLQLPQTQPIYQNQDKSQLRNLVYDESYHEG